MKTLLPPKLFLLALILMIALHLLWPLARLLAFPFTLFGIPFLGGGLFLLLGGSRMFARLGTNIKTFNEPGILVTDGLFQLSRNPMYLGFLLSLLGVALILGSLSPLFIVTAFFFITDRWYISFEEKAMTEKFGEDYKKYQAQTRRWV